MMNMEMTLAICFVVMMLVIAMAFIWLFTSIVRSLVERARERREGLAMLDYYVNN